MPDLALHHIHRKLSFVGKRTTLTGLLLVLRRVPLSLIYCNGMGYVYDCVFILVSSHYLPVCLICWRTSWSFEMSPTLGCRGETLIFDSWVTPAFLMSTYWLSSQEKSPNSASWQSAAAYQVFLISGGLGINLTKATTVIIVESDWILRTIFKPLLELTELGKRRLSRYVARDGAYCLRANLM